MATLAYDTISRETLRFTRNFDSAPQTPVRLTARGRRVLSVLIVLTVALAVYAFSALFAGIASATTSDLTYSETAFVVVEPGQTLWQIATEIDSSADPRAVIDVIEDLNAMGASDVIQAGQVLVVPVVE